ncbi:hypothetical protein Ferp_0510 [Ferroglobus placidus DSM 10642]|uniref:Uncharacterized protein n=1 Tax=Ferroglobus placidus (strain DSM 10642 / AEDII12DO) TaxID=589924 RepID=D3S351_FERPA|nr:DUF6744 family protein [Ferroglobus placidus]ADC64684.1 hypothetical protein Ferp_0510 [Ferroglobus placidus DSM 10642]
MERAKVSGKEVVFLSGEGASVLGYAVWYTFSRFTEHKDVVKEWFSKHGLAEFTPEDPHHPNVFKRICSEYKEKRIKSLGSTEVYLLVRPIDRAGRVRKLVMEKRSEGRRLSYEVVGEIAYDEGVVRYSTSDPDAEEVAREIAGRFEREKDCHTEETLRRALLDIIERSGKVKLKPSGSVYFIPARDFHYIEKFARIVEEIRQRHPDNRTEIWFAPIMDTEQFRDMVKLKVEDTLQETLDAAIKRMVELSSDTVDERERERRLKEIAATVDNAAKVADRYSKMLRQSLNRTDRLLERARTILEKLQRAAE